MSSFKFDQVTASSKDFYKVIPIDYYTLDVDNIMVWEPITCAKTDTVVRQIFAWFYFRELIFRWFRVDIFSRIIITVIFRVDIFSRILGKGRKYILRKSQNFIKLLYAPKYSPWVHWKNVFNIRDFLYP